MEQWKNILSVKLQKDALKDYQLELFNEALAVISEGAKLEEEKKNDKNIIYDKNSNDIKELRNSIVHPYNKKNMPYNDLEKILEKKFTKKKEKLPEILIVNVGDINYYKVDNTNNTAKIQDMNKITSVMSLLKSTQEFNLYNKFSDSLDVNEKLKILMKKLSRMYNFNQVTSLTSKFRKYI